MDTITSTSPREILEVSAVNRIVEGAIIAQAGVIQEGTVLGKITTSGKLAICDSASVDGSEVPFAVAFETVDTTSEDKVAPVYLKGSFNKNALILGGSTTVDDVYDDMRIRSLWAFDTTLEYSI